MTTPVKLYVYDLSNGMARQLSRQLTGRQIDGIWHTSVVIFGKEYFYGQGIAVTLPGKSHHGSPLEVVDMGETALDEGTFGEYLTEMRDHYTADKYHLLDFNCNSFTNDVVGFLTGGSIPPHIRDLPTDFLSTPFGAALRPQIDAMFRCPTPNAFAHSSQSAVNPSPNPQLTSSILQAVAAQASYPNGSASNAIQPTASIAGSVHISTNRTSFDQLLRSHRVFVAFFTSATCGPCRMIEPVFEELAKEKGGRQGVAFTKVDMGVGMGNSIASEWNVQVTPTFLFFLDGAKKGELKGVNAPELKTQVDLLLFEAYPPHPHTSLSLPTLSAISLNPILFTQIPALDTALTKLMSFIDAASWSQPSSEVKSYLAKTVIAYIKARFTNKTLPLPATKVISPAPFLTKWAELTKTLVGVLPLAELFPVVDMWRLALMDPGVTTWLTTLTSNSTMVDPLSLLVDHAILALSLPPTTTPSPRNFILTTLRLLANTFVLPTLGQRTLGDLRGSTTALLIPTLLHEDASVRVAAASLAFNVAAFLQKTRQDTGSRGGEAGAWEDEEWEISLVSALLESVSRSSDEEVIHRLTASLGLMARMSPFWNSGLKPLLEVLQGGDVLRGKLDMVKKKEVKKLLEEVSGLCP